MKPDAPLAFLETSARTARTAAQLVTFALTVTALVTFFGDQPIPAIGLIIAAGTLSHTAHTLHVVLQTAIGLADDIALDDDIIASQNHLIVALRQDRPDP